jgi:hypothetical protein
VVASVDDGVALVSTAEPTVVLARLSAWALEHCGELEQLSVTRPSLEDVYLALTAASAEGEPTPAPAPKGTRTRGRR